jgi:hypothetical protein
MNPYEKDEYHSFLNIVQDLMEDTPYSPSYVNTDMYNPILKGVILKGTPVVSPAPKAKKVKKEGNARLKNWEYIPECIRLFYEDIILKSVVIRNRKSGNVIQMVYPVKINANGYGSSDIDQWVFKFDKEAKKFGFHCYEQEIWMYNINEIGIGS